MFAHIVKQHHVIEICDQGPDAPIVHDREIYGSTAQFQFFPDLQATFRRFGS